MTDQNRKTVELVAEFARVFGQDFAETPTAVSEGVQLLRMQLIGEEIAELIHAVAKKDRVEILDALTDIQYVLDGTYVSYGLQGSYPVEFDTYQEEDTVGVLASLSLGLGYAARHMNLCSYDAKFLPNLAGALNELNRSLQEAYVHFGFADVKMAAFEEVHSSNMSKLDDEGKPLKDESGRILKSANYRAPDLAQFVPSEENS